MLAVLRNIFSVLLALLLCIMTGWHGGSAAASPLPYDPPPACHCCNADGSNCATPACCARPADNGAPATPAIPRGTSGNEWHAVLQAAVRFVTLSSTPLHDLSQAHPAIQVGAVPIYQRNCSFLI